MIQTLLGIEKQDSPSGTPPINTRLLNNYVIQIEGICVIDGYFTETTTKLVAVSSPKWAVKNIAMSLTPQGEAH